MASRKPQRAYNCTQSELYTICNIGWNNCLGNLAAFAAFNTRYTMRYINKAISEITSAIELPREKEGDARSVIAHKQLVTAGEKCLEAWRDLRDYIRSSFPPEYVKMKTDGAGKPEYKFAKNHNWKQLQQMMVAGSKFISANKVILLAGGMPPDFPSVFNNAFSAFSPLYLASKSVMLTNREATNERIRANNALYNKLQQMLRDGQNIFENDPTNRNKFVFTEIKKLVTVRNGNRTSASSLALESGVTANSSKSWRKLRKALLQKANAYLAMF